MRAGRILENERGAVICLFLFLVLFFHPFFFRGKVVYPHENRVELGLETPADKNYHSSDEVRQYLPAFQHILRGDSEGWFSAWDPSVQLGRPAMQLGGLSPVYLPHRIFSFFTKDPFVLYTLLILFTVFVMGFGLFFLMREIDLSPAAAFAAAAGFSTSAWPMNRILVVPVLSTIAWTAMILWLSARFMKKPGWGTGCAAAFSVHALFLSGYPQMIVLEGYLAGAWLLYLWASPRVTRESSTRLLRLIVFFALGALTVLPVYLDVWVRAERSIRAVTKLAYFMKHASFFGGTETVLLSLFLLGPLFFCLLGSVFRRSWMRALWPWLAFTLFCFALKMAPPFFEIAVRYLGFHLSKNLSLSIYGALPALAVICGFVLDRILKGEAVTFRRLGVCFGIYLLGLVWLTQRAEVKVTLSDNQLWMLAGAAAPTAGLFFLRRSSVILVAAVACVSFGWVQESVPWQRLSKIHTTSPLVESIREEMRGEGRFAFVGRRQALQPNLEALTGLRSIHSYESLPSRDYIKWAGSIGEEYDFLKNRVFESPASDLSDLAEAGVNLFLSAEALEHPLLEEVRRSAGYRFYRPRFPVKLEKHIVGADELPARRLEDRDDLKRFSLQPAGTESLLFVSEQYHPHWRAYAGRYPLRTVEVKDLYLGVVVPPRTEDVLLRFEPFSLWMWVPQAAFLAAGAVLLLAALLKGARRPSPAGGA